MTIFTSNNCRVPHTQRTLTPRSLVVQNRRLGLLKPRVFPASKECPAIGRITEPLVGAVVTIAAAAMLTIFPHAALASVQTVPVLEAMQLAKPIPKQAVDKRKIWAVFVGGAAALFVSTAVAEKRAVWFPAIAKANKAKTMSKEEQHHGALKVEAAAVQASTLNNGLPQGHVVKKVQRDLSDMAAMADAESSKRQPAAAEAAGAASRTISHDNKTPQVLGAPSPYTAISSTDSSQSASDQSVDSSSKPMSGPGSPQGASMSDKPTLASAAARTPAAPRSSPGFAQKPAGSGKGATSGGQSSQSGNRLKKG